MSNVLDFDIQQGETFVRLITYSDDDGAIDVSGWTARMKITGRKRNANDTAWIPDTADEKLDCTSFIVVGTTDGLFTLTIPAASTAALPDEACMYDFEAVSAAGAVTKLLRGAVNVIMEATT